MNPKLLLSYACERTVLPGGARMFKHFATSLESQHLFVYIFWFIHCKFFQVSVCGCKYYTAVARGPLKTETRVSMSMALQGALG